MKRGSDFIIPFEAKNEYGGAIDLTGASIYFTLKDDPDSTSILITKENTAGGGSDSEIEVINATNGLGVVKILRTDTLALTNRNYYYDIFVDNAEDSVVINSILRLEKTVRGSGIAVVPQVLGLAKSIVWEMVNGTITKLASLGWTSDPVASHNAGVVTITSSDSELLDAMIFDSNNNDYNIQQWSAAQAKIGWASTSGTIRFWINYYN